MMYTCEEGELGGVRSYSLSDARGMVDAARAKKRAESGKPDAPVRPAMLPMPKGDGRAGEKADAKPLVAGGSGTPLGRAFRKFLGG